MGRRKAQNPRFTAEALRVARLRIGAELAEREIEALWAYALGKNAKEVAAEQWVATSTIKAQLQEARLRTGDETSHQLMARAWRSGFMDALGEPSVPAEAP